jgi:hypothetical protein
LISISASAFAQGAVFLPTSVLSQTSLLHIAQCVFYDIDLALIFIKSGKKRG